MIEQVLASVTVELVVIGVIIAALVMGWLMTNGFIDEFGPLIGFALAALVGTVLPAIYIMSGVSAM